MSCISTRVYFNSVGMVDYTATSTFNYDSTGKLNFETSNVPVNVSNSIDPKQNNVENTKLILSTGKTMYDLYQAGTIANYITTLMQTIDVTIATTLAIEHAIYVIFNLLENEEI